MFRDLPNYAEALAAAHLPGTRSPNQFATTIRTDVLYRLCAFRTEGAFVNANKRRIARCE